MSCYLLLFRHELSLTLLLQQEALVLLLFYKSGSTPTYLSRMLHSGRPRADPVHGSAPVSPSSIDSMLPLLAEGVQGAKYRPLGYDIR